MALKIIPIITVATMSLDPRLCTAGAVAIGLIMVPRFRLAYHEDIHVQWSDAKEAANINQRVSRCDRALRKAMSILPSGGIPMSLFQMSGKDYIKIHNEHHTASICETDDDPDIFMIRGSPSQAIIKCILEPEIMTLRRVTHGKEISSIGLIKNGMWLIVWICLTHKYFLYWWASARIANGAFYFIFDYLTHRNTGTQFKSSMEIDDNPNNYKNCRDLNISRKYYPVLKFIYGNEIIHLIKHRCHHSSDKG